MGTVSVECLGEEEAACEPVSLNMDGADSLIISIVHADYSK